MSHSRVLNAEFRQTGDEEVTAGRAFTQRGWYRFAASFCAAQEVLDVGCGLGGGFDELEATAASVRGIDLDARLDGARIERRDIRDEPDKSVDTVVNIDVLEHVLEDHEFIDSLARVARRQILLSTPNFAASFCRWPYHVREYLPDELMKLFAAKGRVHLYKGTQAGDEHYPVEHPGAFAALNKLRVHPISGQPTRVFQKLLRRKARIHSHLFIRVELFAGD